MKKLILPFAAALALTGCAASDLFFTDEAELNINTSPMGAMVCAANNQCFNQAPTMIKVHKKWLVKVSGNSDDDCWQLEKDFIIKWPSGMETTGNFYWCGRPVQRVNFTFVRPNGGDLQTDLEHEANVAAALAQKQMVANQQLMLMQMQQQQMNPYQKIGNALGRLFF